MDTYEKVAMLESMRVVVDTREQLTDKAMKRYQSFKCPFIREKINYGDYTYTAKLPNGKWLHQLHAGCGGISPPLTIERKQNLDELAGCFTHDRARFEREFERAKANNGKIVLLVEDASWENLLNGRYRSKFNSNAFSASVCAWAARYNLNLFFCKSETSGRIIHDLLYYDLKERIEKGFYDCRGDQKESFNAGDPKQDEHTN
jgi:ERCC4-type nuclease